MSKLAELAEMLREERRSTAAARISTLQDELHTLQEILDRSETVLVEGTAIEEPTDAPPKPIIEEVLPVVRPAPPEPSPSTFIINQIQKDMQNLRKMVEKNHSMQYIGSGGGAGDIVHLDHPTRLVTGNYTVGRFDYYIGVNHTTATYITLPTSGISDGRKLVIKDESGKANLIPIYLVGTIDNDVNGATLRINNGALQLIYRNGWRVI